MIRLYYCECCKKAKEWSEMHSEILCKNCWSRAEHNFHSARARRAWNTYQLNRKTRKILK